MTKKEREFLEALEALGDPKKHLIRTLKKDVKLMVKEYTKEMNNAKTPQEKIEIDKKWQNMKNKCVINMTLASVLFDEK